MPTIHVKITDSQQPKPWFASAWNNGQDVEKAVKSLNRKAKATFAHSVVYELATEAEYQTYRNELKESTK